MIKIDTLDKINYDKTDPIEITTYEMTKHSIQLLNETEKLINKNQSFVVFPLLRQVYENTMISIGMYEKYINFNDFLNANIEGNYVNLSNKIKDKLISAATKQNENAINMFDEFLKILLKKLHNHTHAGFNRLSRFILENSEDEAILNFIKSDSLIIKLFVESLFYAFISKKYNLNIKNQELRTILNQLDLKNLLSIDEKIKNELSKFYDIDEVKEYINDLGSKNYDLLIELSKNKDEFKSFFDKLNKKTK